MTKVFVAAGSNVDPLANLQRALLELKKHYRLKLSPAYRNKAVGFEGEDFINLVIEFETTDSVEQVIAHLHEAEAVCGRPRDAPKWAPRTMDLDLLLFGDLVHDDERVKLPRRDLTKRAYMLRPMAELAPDVRHPILGRTMRELWSEFDSKGHEMSRVNFQLKSGGTLV
ncbi:MAG TPA: 2-amino-4-hydroxy-6-hydroxymethyldihydropteridine diphosphokinase [Steroidobacteraceae bacterium]|nr:2-amino-4-hydroxy-6-hydroxymethyldihydropteridine diphosphokinase [Steroidobacteraceae bacterium]